MNVGLVEHKQNAEGSEPNNDTHHDFHIQGDSFDSGWWMECHNGYASGIGNVVPGEGNGGGIASQRVGGKELCVSNRKVLARDQRRERNRDCKV